MKTFVGVKLIKAQPMTYSEWCGHKGFPLEAEKANDEGYLVEYPDGYQSWSPAAVFEASYLELNDPTRITSGDVIRFLGIEPYTVGQLDDKTTIVKVTTRTGFVAYETSSCVEPSNYDETVGIDQCIDRLNSKIWPMLGFILQWARHGLDSVKELTINTISDK